jgi:hypothetical protein
MNLYQYANNSPVNFLDPLGLDIWIGGPSCSPHQNINVGDPDSDHVDSYTYGLESDSYFSYLWPPWPTLRKAQVYKDFRSSSPKSQRIRTTPKQDEEAREILDGMLGQGWGYGLTGGNCRDFSQDMFDFFVERYVEERNSTTAPILITAPPSFNIHRNVPVVWWIP